MSASHASGAGPERPVKPGDAKDLDDLDWVYMVPGIGYHVMKFANTTGPNLFHGAQIEYIFAGGRLKRRYTRPPEEDIDVDRQNAIADFRFYGKIGLLSANSKSVSRMFMGGIGVNFSFEGSIRRNFFIPHYGFECNIYNQAEKKGGIVFTPVAGIFIYSSTQLRVNYTAGVNLMPSHYQTYRSLSQCITLNYSLW